MSANFGQETTGTEVAEVLKNAIKGRVCKFKKRLLWVFFSLSFVVLCLMGSNSRKPLCGFSFWIFIIWARGKINFLV
jgi:hypothetical protein